MGRFETAAEFYASREPYSAEFFRALARRLGLSGHERLVDLACGPAQLALGMAPFVKEVIGVDVEPAMLQMARANAVDAGGRLCLIDCRVEELPETLGAFGVVMIGRALHWLDRERTLAVLDRIVAPNGFVAICYSTADVVSNTWWAGYKSVRNRWSSETDEQRYKIDAEAWAAGSRFRKVDELRVPSRRAVAVDDIVRRALSMSTTSPAVVGDRRAEFETEVRAAVLPFAHEGLLEEHVVSVATLLQ